MNVSVNRAHACTTQSHQRRRLLSMNSETRVMMMSGGYTMSAEPKQQTVKYSPISVRTNLGFVGHTGSGGMADANPSGAAAVAAMRGVGAASRGFATERTTTGGGTTTKADARLGSATATASARDAGMAPPEHGVEIRSPMRFRTLWRVDATRSSCGATVAHAPEVKKG